MINQKSDVFCVARFSLSEPRFSRIRAADPAIRLIGGHRVVDEDGYLGVSLTRLESLWLEKVLRKLGVDARPVRECYKSANMTAHDAKHVAQKFVMRKRADRPDVDLEFGGVCMKNRIEQSQV